VLHQECIPAPGGVVDATGAGDAFRAAFVAALAEERPPRACLRFAAAAGAIAVSRMGAVPSLPARDEAEALSARVVEFMDASFGGDTHVHVRGEGAADAAPAVEALRGGGGAEESGAKGNGSNGDKIEAFPMLFGSRLNSMKDRADLWSGPEGVLGWIARQARCPAPPRPAPPRPAPPRPAPPRPAPPRPAPPRPARRCAAAPGFRAG
jgi:hypothetical protein